MIFQCPHCRKQLKVGTGSPVAAVRCPHCRGLFRVPTFSGLVLNGVEREDLAYGAAPWRLILSLVTLGLLLLCGWTWYLFRPAERQARRDGFSSGDTVVPISSHKLQMGSYASRSDVTGSHSAAHPAARAGGEPGVAYEGGDSVAPRFRALLGRETEEGPTEKAADRARTPRPPSLRPSRLSLGNSDGSHDTYDTGSRSWKHGFQNADGSQDAYDMKSGTWSVGLGNTDGSEDTLDSEYMGISSDITEHHFLHPSRPADLPRLGGAFSLRSPSVRETTERGRYLGSLSTNEFGQDGQYLGRLSSNRYAGESTSNPYGPYGSRYSPTSIRNPYSVYGSPYSSLSPTNPYALSGPKLYGQDGQYLGRLSSNPYAWDSTSNPYGPYGSRYSPTSIRNPYSVYGSPYSSLSPTNPYSTQSPIIISDD